MSTTQNSGTTDTEPRPGYFNSAREYALDRLKQDEPMTPANLADEYGCGGVHMRQTLADLASEGKIERVSRGHYVLPGDGTDTDTAESTGSNDGDTTRSGAGFRSTADLYQEQHTTDTDDEDTEDATGSTATVPVEPGSGDPDGDDGGDAAGGGVPLPADPKTLGLILGVALVLWIAFRSLGGSGHGADAGTVEDSTDDEQDQLGGGLAQ